MGLKDTLFGKVLRKKETTQKSHEKIDIYAQKVESIDDLELSSELEKSIPRDLMDKIRAYDSVGNVYGYPLKTKISLEYTMDIVRDFFASIDLDISNKINDILDDKSEDAYLELRKYDGKEDSSVSNPNNRPVRVFVPLKGDLRDVYDLVHELTHTLDIDNGDTTTRKILGEVAPQCMERMLDDFLLSMPEGQKQRYGFNLDDLKKDINKRKMTTFISRWRNAFALNHRKGNRVLNSRYVLSQIYSTKFMKYGKNERKCRIIQFIEHVKSDEFEKANNDFEMEIDRSNSLQRRFLISDCIEEANNIPDSLEILTGKIKEISNYEGKRFTLYCYKSKDNFYYLIALPETFSENCKLMVESYNSGGKSKKIYEENVLEALYNGNSIENLITEVVRDAPIVLPITPDIIGENDSQMLSLESIKDDKIHLKFMECIIEAREKIKQLSGKKVSDKIFLNGYSASGVFAQRFALIYPGVIDSCLVGGAAGTIPIPSDALEYPLRNKKLSRTFWKRF